ncbi:Uncharacterised protein [Actinobacillus equuli]|nr:Uncharacterised protein [Actinobacillus equuli]
MAIPIYDFAPMRADPEGIIRTTTWAKNGDNSQEFAGEYRFDKIVDSLSDLIEPDILLRELRMLATQLVDLNLDLRSEVFRKAFRFSRHWF